MRIYLDTSVISALLAQEAPHLRAATQVFFEQRNIRAMALYGSDLVIAEIDRTRDAHKRQRLRRLVEEHEVEILSTTEEVRALAERYVTAKIIPAKYLPDALHIALAVVHHIGILVSWNFEHIVRHRTRLAVNHLNQTLNYPTVDLCTPEEV